MIIFSRMKMSFLFTFSSHYLVDDVIHVISHLSPNHFPKYLTKVVIENQTFFWQLTNLQHSDNKEQDHIHLPNHPSIHSLFIKWNFNYITMGILCWALKNAHNLTSRHVALKLLICVSSNKDVKRCAYFLFKPWVQKYAELSLT